jgi:hypothetical protein
MNVRDERTGKDDEVAGQSEENSLPEMSAA